MSGAERCVNPDCRYYPDIHEGMCTLISTHGGGTEVKNARIVGVGLEKPGNYLPGHEITQPEYQHGGDDPIIHTMSHTGMMNVILELRESGKVTWREAK